MSLNDVLNSFFLRQVSRGRYGFLVYRSGEVIAQGYGNGFSSDSLFEIGSLRKSFNSALIGRGIESGEVDLHVLAYRLWPELLEIGGVEKDKMITLHHLVSAVSGWLTPDIPGVRFLYNNAAFTAAERVAARMLRLPNDETAPVLADIFKKALGAISWRFYHWDRLFDPNRYQTTGPKLAVDSTLQDMLAWGLLWLSGGNAGGHRLIPERWINLATSRVNPQIPEANYGYNWFINDRSTVWPGLPSDSYGHTGSGSFRSDDAKSRCFLWICPSLDLAVVSIVPKTSEDTEFFETASPQARELLSLIVGYTEGTQ